jgi:hypothetical protein
MTKAKGNENIYNYFVKLKELFAETLISQI